MRHRHSMAIDRIVYRMRVHIGVEMRDKLVAIEVKIDPVIRRAPFAAAQNIAVKGACRRKIMHRKGEVKRAQAHCG